MPYMKLINACNVLYGQRKNEARSCSHCFSGKVINSNLHIMFIGPCIIVILVVEE